MAASPALQERPHDAPAKRLAFNHRAGRAACRRPDLPTRRLPARWMIHVAEAAAGNKPSASTRAPSGATIMATPGASKNLGVGAITPRRRLAAKALYSARSRKRLPSCVDFCCLPPAWFWFCCLPLAATKDRWCGHPHNRKPRPRRCRPRPVRCRTNNREPTLFQDARSGQRFRRDRRPRCPA